MSSICFIGISVFELLRYPPIHLSLGLFFIYLSLFSLINFFNGGGGESLFLVRRMEKPSTKIVINFTWTNKMLHCKGEPYQFKGIGEILRYRQKSLLLYKIGGYSFMFMYPSINQPNCKSTWILMYLSIIQYTNHINIFCFIINMH